jgi:ABC-type cobalamin/Fe3+-siderophores transport system ATPase subunit
MSSHLPDHALLYSDRVALMKGGGFIALGDPDEVLTEKNLSSIYEIDVRMFSVSDPLSGEEIRFCVPAKEETKEGRKTVIGSTAPSLRERRDYRRIA